jgi:hypothetical protein
MDKKTTAIIVTVATVLCCGCPGLFLCGFGIWGATGTMPYTSTVNGYSQTGTTPAAVGFGMLCAALILIAIPIVTGILMFRKKPEAVVEVPPSEPLPPAA